MDKPNIADALPYTPKIVLSEWAKASHAEPVGQVIDITGKSRDGPIVSFQHQISGVMCDITWEALVGLFFLL